MSEQQKSFWSTMPGIITGVAAIVTGLGALVPVVLSASHGKATHTQNAATSSPDPSTAAGTGASPTVTPGDPWASASPGGTPTPTDSTGIPGATPATGTQAGPAALTANPASLNLGRAASGSATPPATVTLANPGPGPATLDGLQFTGPNAAQFSIASTTCGTGVALAPQATCQVSVRFTAQSLGTASAALVADFHAPSSSISIPLSATGSLL